MMIKETEAPQKYVSVRELSKLVGVSQSSLFRFAALGRLPGLHRQGARYFVDLAEYLSATRVAPPAGEQR